MSLSRYAEQCRVLAEEAVEPLTEGEIEVLRGQLFALGLRGWLAWRAAHGERVAGYVAAAPSARRTQRRWQSDRLLLAFAAYEHCMEAADLLDQVLLLGPGSSYRQMAADAGLAYRHLESRQDWDCWPFPGEDPYNDPAFVDG